MQIVIDSPNGALKTKLAVKQILLGHDAKKDEVNVVEVTTDSWKRDGSENTIPIAVLKLGETQSTLPNLEFPFGLVKFTLVKGSGPVHITGLQFPDVFDVNMDEEEEVSGQDWIWLGLNTTLIVTCNLFLPFPPTCLQGHFSDEDSCSDDEDEDAEEAAAAGGGGDKASKAKDGKKK